MRIEYKNSLNDLSSQRYYLILSIRCYNRHRTLSMGYTGRLFY